MESITFSLCQFGNFYPSFFVCFFDVGNIDSFEQCTDRKILWSPVIFIKAFMAGISFGATSPIINLPLDLVLRLFFICSITFIYTFSFSFNIVICFKEPPQYAQVPVLNFCSLPQNSHFTILASANLILSLSTVRKKFLTLWKNLRDVKFRGATVPI